MNAVPASGGFTGWVYTTESTWRQFGLISTSDAETNLVVDGVFANGEVVGYAGSFTNLNVTGIGTIFNANIQSGISSVDATSTKDLYVSGIATFKSDNPGGIKFEFLGGNVGVHTNIRVNAENDGDVMSITIVLSINSYVSMNSNIST